MSFAQKKELRHINLSNKIYMILMGPGSIRFSLGIVMIFIYLYAAHPTHFNELKLIYGDTHYVDGVTTKVTKTGIRFHDKLVWEIRYKYKPPHSQHGHHGDSYVVSKSKPVLAQPIVNYLIGNPSISQLKNRAANIAMPIYIALSLFALFMSAQGLYLMIRTHNWIKLLVYGEISKATVKGIEQTNIMVNDLPVRKVRYEYPDKHSNTHSFYVSTPHIDNLIDEDEELMFYDPKQKSAPLVFDRLPELIYLNLNQEKQWDPIPNQIMIKRIGQRLIVPLLAITLALSIR